jgi:hypothetical protein
VRPCLAEFCCTCMHAMYARRLAAHGINSTGMPLHACSFS